MDNVNKQIGLTPEKLELLDKLNEAKNKISRKQRKEIYLPLSTILSKATFNQMITGVYVSDANLATAYLLLEKLERLYVENGVALQSLSN